MKSIAPITNRGFTLFDIVIASSILFIGTTLSVSSFLKLKQRITLRSTVRGLVCNLQLARMRAISTNHNCYVDFDPDNDGKVNEDFYTAFLDLNGNKESRYKKDKDEYAASQLPLEDSLGDIPGIKLSKGIKLTCTFNGKRVCFDPWGRGSAGTINISDGDRQEVLAIVVAATGRIRTELKGEEKKTSKKK